MTAYFDSISREIHGALQLPEFEAADALEKIERRLVYDVTVAAELPGFPEDLRDAIHQAVLRYGVVTLPDNAPRADFEFDREYGQRLSSMSDTMHTIFHTYALARGGGPCSDDPQLRLREFYARGDERRERMVETPDA